MTPLYPTSEAAHRHDSFHPMTSPPNGHCAPLLRRYSLGVALAGLAWLGGCASPAEVPSPVMLVLRTQPPVGAAPLLQASPQATWRAPWQLMQPVRVPDYLDHDALLLPQGANGVQA